MKKNRFSGFARGTNIPAADFRFDHPTASGCLSMEPVDGVSREIRSFDLLTERPSSAIPRHYCMAVIIYVPFCGQRSFVYTPMTITISHGLCTCTGHRLLCARARRIIATSSFPAVRPVVRVGIDCLGGGYRWAAGGSVGTTAGTLPEWFYRQKPGSGMFKILNR